VQMVGPGGTQELMFDPSGVWLGIYGVLDLMPWGAGYFAAYNGTDTYFNHINNLGSTSMYSNHAGGTPIEDVLFYPWGQNTWKFQGSGGYSFAAMPYYDTTTDTTLPLFRLYSEGLGRWLSPDPLAGDITNPQSLNRYPYVLNNPTTLTDPFGLQGCPPGTHSIGQGQCAGQVRIPDVGLWWDEFELMDIPVVTDVYVPTELLSSIDWAAMSNSSGYAVSVNIYTQGGWVTTIVGNASMLLSELPPPPN